MSIILHFSGLRRIPQREEKQEILFTISGRWLGLHLGIASRTVVSSAYLSLHSQVVVSRLTKMAKSRGLILDPGEFLHEGIQVMIMIFLPLLFKISQTRRHLSI